MSDLRMTIDPRREIAIKAEASTKTLQRRGSTKTLNPEEDIAVKALQKYNPEATNINVWSSIPNVLGGTVVLIEFQDPDDNEWCVLVRGSRGIVYQEWEDILKQIPDYKPSLLSQISDPQFVVALLTFSILLAAVAAYFWTGDVKEPMRAGLASVVGFWLGRAVPPKEDEKK